MTQAPWAPPMPTVPSHRILRKMWPDRGRTMPLESAGLAIAAGSAAAVLVPAGPPGIGLFAVGLLVAAAAVPAARGRIGPHELGYGLLALLSTVVVVVRDAGWVVGLCLLAATGLGSYALAGGRTLVGTALGCASLPFAALRSAPWVSRRVRRHAPTHSGAWVAVLRATATTVGLLVVFGALFASADAAFSSLLPEVDLGVLPLRVFLFGFFTAVACALAFLAAAPPRFDLLAPGPPRPARMLEWTVPIAALVGLFTVFVAVQMTTLFGGDDHVLRTAGLTHAEYARQGFGQLVTVTVLTLTVVSLTARKAPRDSRTARAVLRSLLGALCALALVVVASALHRLHLYEEAFGFTRLRLFMNVFETWLGLLLVLVMVAGIRLRATWLPRAVVATGAAALLLLASANPDAFVADRNLARFEETGKLDAHYVSGLSLDAAPVLDRLPEPLRSCVLATARARLDGDAEHWAAWNVGRHRARSLLADRPVDAGTTCQTL